MDYNEDVPQPPGDPAPPPRPDDYESLHKRGLVLDVPNDWPRPVPLVYADLSKLGNGD
jgi:hypothetical protein